MHRDQNDVEAINNLMDALDRDDEIDHNFQLDEDVVKELNRRMCDPSIRHAWRIAKATARLLFGK